MHFKKLELIGFKSFADKTSIVFEPGVTAIVGPNGCGKSNISDAIRWVLGEQSAKSLRGSSMEDVIFNGSSVKEPLNLAEVSLTFSNESKILPIEYNEVTITRRLYRSGESEYLLNKNTVRLKDIQELLMGTGIGTESYSVIEQGKMDQILNSRPDERREIFEEAAGITKFKAKKKEALRKLEQTESNLLRINDIIVEVKRQIGSIERQAKKAEVYKVEFEKLKQMELVVASKEFLIFEDRKKTREESLGALREEESKFSSHMKELEERYDEKNRRLHELDETLRDRRTQEFETGAQARRNQDRVLLNRERIGELGARTKNGADQIEAAKRRAAELEAEFGNFAAEVESIRREEEEGRAFLSSVENEFAAFENTIREASAEGGAVKTALFDLANRRAHEQNRVVKAHGELAAVRHGLKKLKEEETALLKEIREINEVISPPLFASQGQGEPAVSRFESRLKDFKDRLLAIVHGLLSRQSAEWGPAAEEEVDREIKIFTEDVVKIHGQAAEHQSRARHLEASKKKLEEKLSVVLFEMRELLAEEETLGGRETEMEKEAVLFAEEEKALNQRLADAQELVRAKTKDKESLIVRLTETRSRQEHRTARREKSEKDRNWVLEAKASEGAALAALEREMAEASARRQALEEESAVLERETVELLRRRDEILIQTDAAQREREAFVAELSVLEKEKNERFEFLKSARDKVHAFELENTEIRFEIDRLKERIYNAYQVDLAAALVAEGEEFNLEEAKANIQSQREKLNRMGPVNLVAIQEYDEMRERFDFLTRQEQDLTRAKDDLHKAILKINRTTKELFIDTFQKIQKYFTEYYRLLFGGGTAELVLLDEEDVLESGIEMVARPPGKKLQSISLLSGGEKALTATALLFALFKVKPSPFCILDEIDAPLDESNVDRFCGVLRQFIQESQFILITHNKRTMNLADALYGITMAENGVTKIISARINDKRPQPVSEDKQEVLV